MACPTGNGDGFSFNISLSSGHKAVASCPAIINRLRFLELSILVQKPSITPLLLVLLLIGLAVIGLPIVGGVAWAQSLPGGGSQATGANIAATRHNLSNTAPTRQATSQNLVTIEQVVTGGQEICVFCHTPHGKTTDVQAPLWNRAESSAAYTGYSSSTLDATDLSVTAANLGASSKLCLSCHDGTIAVGTVSNAPGPGAGTGITTTPSGSIPTGRGLANADHGFTRRLGTDLRNDHPISFTYNSALAAADGEIRDPATSPPTIGDRVKGQAKPDFVLSGGKVQCSTCHDPHRNSQKFLVKNRMVVGTSTQSSWTNWTFDSTNDQICVGCHTRLGKAWQQSAHADQTAANEAYTTADGAMRDFMTGTTVWQAGCLNCHDTHTVAGSRRLLREGAGSGVATQQTVAGTIGYTANFRPGSTTTADYNTTSAIENTCYQCHSTSPVITVPTLSASEGVPNIQAEFAKTYRMPITNADQGESATSNTSEVHDITNGDFIESQTQLGLYTPQNRHVECTDCHNPHRVVKANTFLGNQLNDAGSGITKDLTRRTHSPAAGTGGKYGNIASGALRGTWGVEPSYTESNQTTVTSTSIWMSAAELPTYTVKKGDPGAQATLPSGSAGTNLASYLTREYQLCFKCHSNYSNGPLATDFPNLKSTNGRGTTASTTNRMTRYTNVAAEFAVLATDGATNGTHQGEAVNTGGTACSGGDCTPVGAPWDTTTNAGTINHRSWHPVVFPTGRTNLERCPSTGSCSPTFGNIRAPFAANVGTQTMHCSDCHGSGGSWTGGSGPNLGTVQGPHGSNNYFLLRGAWGNTNDPNTVSTNLSNVSGTTQLCGNCHFPVGTGAALKSGFNGNHEPVTEMSGFSCTRCHIAVPHGWKNKAFLVNKRCVGKEGGKATDCATDTSGFGGDFNAPPYYVGARNSFSTWRAAGDSNYGNETNTCSGNGDMKGSCVKQAQ